MFKQITTVSVLMISAFTFSQVGIDTPAPKATLDVVGKPADNTVLDGIIAPRIEGAELRAKTYTTEQTGALVYVTLADTAPAGQTIDVTAAGYYYFNGLKWVIAGSGDAVNIYNANGSLTSARTLTNNGFGLTFLGTNQSTNFSATGGFTQTGLGTLNKRASIILRSNDNNSDGVTSNLQLFQDPESAGQIMVTGDSRRLNIGTTGNTLSAPITFITSAGSNANGTEKMRITGAGNVGINANNPTEKFDVNGITRLRGLPLNGSVNAIFTMPDGNSTSTTQNQTFTATRTVVADANGVLGYINTLPSDAGTTKVIVNVSVPGTQNLMNAFSPPVTGQFTSESIDTYNAWTDNVFTVPANLTGLYSIVMQNSNVHTSTGTATPTWSTIAFFEKSVDGGANWSELMKHTYSNLAGTIVDNGNTLYWTGFLNAGDQVRVRFNCNSTTDNIVRNGGLSITKIAQ